MKRVLIISDNVELVSFFKDLTKTFLDTTAFDFKYSSINKAPGELVNLGMDGINVKNQVVIDNIIETYELIISAHCKQIFPEALVKNVRCINIHPGLNPYNRGWFPQVFSLLNKLPIGCTIHEMDVDIDHGDIIYQKEVEIREADTSKDLYLRVQEAEKSLIKKNLSTLLAGNYEKKKMHIDGNYNGIDDFKNLCKLDLDQIGTLKEHLDLLRALTHGQYKNAYFVVEDKKFFVSINIEESKLNS